MKISSASPNLRGHTTETKLSKMFPALSTVPNLKEQKAETRLSTSFLPSDFVVYHKRLRGFFTNTFPSTKIK